MSTRIRRPWWAFLLALLFSVVVGLLYVGRPRRALAYVAAALGALALGALGIWSGWAWSVVFFGIAFYGVALVAAVDAFRIARAHRTHFEGAWYTRWHALLGIFVLVHAMTYATGFLVRAYVIEPFRMPSGSMMPTFLVGDYIAAYKWPYGNPGTWDVWLTPGSAPAEKARPARGDIVLFRYPGDPETVYIKRVIGLPGDVVRASGHDLSINGVAAKHTLIAATGPAGDIDETALDVYEETVAGRAYRIALLKAPLDSRPFEAKVPPGHYFVMGDNRDNSNDSRYWGFLPETSIVGRPVVIWWSMDLSGNGLRIERAGMRPQ
jgi:signal peptidase I